MLTKLFFARHYIFYGISMKSFNLTTEAGDLDEDGRRGIKEQQQHLLVECEWHG